MNPSDDLPRRALLRGGALAAAASGGLGPTAAFAAEPPPYAGQISAVPNRAALAAIDNAAPGRLVHLDERGREGLFRCVPAMPSAASIDPLQGLYVPAGRGALGWVRVWDGTHGRPEWFGARVNDGRADCADALEACFALCPVTELAQADYFVQRTVRFARSWRTVRGSGRYATDEGQGTRIILQAAAPALRTADIVLLGSAGKPAGDLVTETHLSDFTIIRDGPSAPHASGDLARYPTGLRASYLSHCTISGVSSLESSVGFYIGGVVYTKFGDCLAQRLKPSEGAGSDLTTGFFLDGRIEFGFAGGNASLYMDRCATAEQHAHHVNPAGLIAMGAFVDSFIDRFESARIDTGMAFHAAGARAFGQTIDLHVRSPVLDACGKFGIDLDLDATSSASVEIIDPYVTPAAGRGDRGILVRDGAGLVTITGGQVLGDWPGGSLFISRTRGVRVQGLKIQQAVRPVVVAEADGCQLEPQISNYAKTAPGPAIECRALSLSSIRPTIIGFVQPAFNAGVSLDKTSKHVEVNGSAIDPACLAGGVAAKVRYSGEDARGSGAFTAARNVLSGVTG